LNAAIPNTAGSLPGVVLRNVSSTANSARLAPAYNANCRYISPRPIAGGSGTLKNANTNPGKIAAKNRRYPT
jgi:hypothetical protein